MTVPLTEQEALARRISEELAEREQRLRSWLKDWSIGRIEAPQYVNPTALKKDIRVLLDDRTALQASLVAAQEALRQIVGFPIREEEDGFTAGWHFAEVRQIARAALAGTAERQEQEGATATQSPVVGAGAAFVKGTWATVRWSDEQVDDDEMTVLEQSRLIRAALADALAWIARTDERQKVTLGLLREAVNAVDDLLPPYIESSHFDQRDYDEWDDLRTRGLAHLGYDVEAGSAEPPALGLGDIDANFFPPAEPPAKPEEETNVTKPLDPEIKALRAVTRALEPLDQEQRQRGLEWVVAFFCGLPGISLPPVASAGLPVKEGDDRP